MIRRLLLRVLCPLLAMLIIETIGGHFAPYESVAFAQGDPPRICVSPPCEVGGLVKEYGTDIPIRSAVVKVIPSKSEAEYIANSDSEGSFYFPSIPSATSYEVICTGIGYEEKSIQTSASTLFVGSFTILLKRNS